MSGIAPEGSAEFQKSEIQAMASELQRSPFWAIILEFCEAEADIYAGLISEHNDVADTGAIASLQKRLHFYRSVKSLPNEVEGRLLSMIEGTEPKMKTREKRGRSAFSRRI